MSERVAIIGGGALGQQIGTWLKHSKSYSIAGFYDDTIPRGECILDNIKCLGNIESVPAGIQANEFDSLIIGIGYKHLNFRQALFEKFQAQISLARFLHPTAFIGPNSTVGEGAMIYPSVVIDQSVQIQQNVLLNLNVIVSHDSIIGAHSFLAPGSVVCGNVTIGKRCFIGANATVNDGVVMPDDTTIGSGAVVTTSILTPGVYTGVPARRLPK